MVKMLTMWNSFSVDACNKHVYIVDACMEDYSKHSFSVNCIQYR